MSIIDLEKIFEKEPKYRLAQAKQALYSELIEDWRESTNIPKELKQKLNKEFPIAISGKFFVSKNKNTTKAFISLKDDLAVETVLMKHANKRNTVCVSSQVGCPLGCSFCATGRMGFKRNLNAQEIVEQVLFFARYLKKSKEKITNIVFMGMGEPFLNYENVIESIKTLNDKQGFNMGARHFSISTAGIISGIEKLAQESLQVNLAISLHATNNIVRSKIMPINEKYPIEKVLKAVKEYVKKTKRRVMIEYMLIRGLNDSLNDAEKLSNLLKNCLCFVNLINHNPIGELKPCSQKRAEDFKKILEDFGITVTQRYRLGLDIRGACGQLAIINDKH